MVRESYKINHDPCELRGGPLDILGADSATNLRGFRRFRQDWGISWDLFFELNQAKPQLSLAIDASLAKPLRNLRFPFTADEDSLPRRNLQRGLRLALPSGESVAEALGEAPVNMNLSDLTGIKEAFEHNTPLWYYILKEAEIKNQGKTLGPVGSRIVLETFVGILLEDGHSYLRQNPLWRPPSGPEFGMPEFIQVVNGSRRVGP
jgi:hypothetical protein